MPLFKYFYSTSDIEILLETIKMLIEVLCYYYSIGLLILLNTNNMRGFSLLVSEISTN